MQLQDAPANYLFRIWPWIEANRIRLIWGGGIVLVVAGLFSFFSWQHGQKEIAAGEALTKLSLSFPPNTPPSQQADSFLKMAADYQNTPAAQQALVQGAVLLFEAGRYGDAQVQFQKYLDSYPGGAFAPQAALGVASCLDALGKTDQAAGNYQQIINTYSDPMVANLARFGLAQIAERRGKVADAINYYQDITRALPNSSLGQEAGLCILDLQSGKPTARASTAAPAASSNAPFQLVH